MPSCASYFWFSGRHCVQKTVETEVNNIYTLNEYTSSLSYSYCGGWNLSSKELSCFDFRCYYNYLQHILASDFSNWVQLLPGVSVGSRVLRTFFSVYLLPDCFWLLLSVNLVGNAGKTQDGCNKVPQSGWLKINKLYI